MKLVSAETKDKNRPTEGKCASDVVHVGAAFVRYIRSRKGKVYFYLVVRMKVGGRYIDRVLLRLTPDEASAVYLNTLARSFAEELEKLKSAANKFEETQKSVERLSALGINVFKKPSTDKGQTDSQSNGVERERKTGST